MKSILKKILSVVLCVSLCAGFAVIPVGAAELDDSLISADLANVQFYGRESVDETTKLLYEIKGHTAALWGQMAKEQQALTPQVMNMRALVSVIQGISTVVSIVSGIVSLLQIFGVFGDGGEAEFRQSVLDGIYSLQYSVEKIDKKVDAIQNTLVEEFSKIDLNFQTQEYNHYKDDVWAQFYAEAVAPLTALQNEYADTLNWNMVSYTEQWLDDGDCDLRALFGEDGKGGYMQVFAAKNFGDPGDKLPRKPSVSVDSIPVRYAVTLPGKYVADNMDNTVALTSDNCIALLKAAAEKGVYAAAENGELKAYTGFDSEWAAMTEEEKTALASELAKQLTDAVAFAAAYQASNEKKFASDVKSAFDYFCKWLKGSDNLTSPMYAQLKMLSLTHAFEGEVTDYAETIYVYLELLAYNFAVLTETVLSMSKAHTLKNREEVRREWLDATKALKLTCADFLTGNANYCYILGKTIAYKDVSLESRTEFYHPENLFINPRKAQNKEYWSLHDKTVPAPQNDEERKKQSSALHEALISSRELQTLYCMYTGQVKKNLTTAATFVNYLIGNKVIAGATSGSYPYGVNTAVVTSCDTEPIDMTKGEIFSKGAFSTGLPTQDYNNGLFDFDEPALLKNGSKPPFLSDYKIESDSVNIHDRAIGGLFDITNGDHRENTVFDARIAMQGAITTFFSDSDSIERVYDDPDNINVSSFTYITSKAFGAIVEVPSKSYSFPVDTKTIKDNYFGKNETIEKLTLNGSPETIADNAFAGVGNENERCFLSVPEELETGSLLNTWYGGCFGDVYIIADKNDGSGETRLLAAVNGAPCTSVLCPYTIDEIPEYTDFLGWSLTPDGKNPADNSDLIYSGMKLYAIWKADHEHEFTVTGAKEATCTARGATGKAVCSVCGYTVKNEVIDPLGHTCEFSVDSSDVVTATCAYCAETFTLTPNAFGDITVWATADDIGSGNIYPDETGDGKLVIDTSSPVMLQSVGTTASGQLIEIAPDNSACAALNGVKITAAVSDKASALSVGTGSSLNLYLMADAVNTFTGSYDRPGIALAEDALGLTVYGSGVLNASSQFGSAGIGSRAGEKCPAISILGGTVTATCRAGENTAIGAPQADGSTKKIVIGKQASVMVNVGDGQEAFGCDPVNEEGKPVYPVMIENKGGADIYIDGEKLPMVSHQTLERVYVYLTGEEHEVTVGDKTVRYIFVESGTTGTFETAREFGDFTVTLSNDYGASYENGVLEIFGNDPVTVRNTDPTKATSDTIRVLSGERTLILDGVNIVSGDKAAIRLSDPCHTVIRLADGSVNTLVSGDGHAGIENNLSNSFLTVTGSGTLYATGGKYGAGIGSGSNSFAGSITIENGTIYATGGEGGAGIGSGKQLMSSMSEGFIGCVPAAEHITIKGGHITAVGGKDAAGIGAGAGSYYISVSDITISNGTVTATGNGAAAGIGGGSKGNASKIHILGGTVTAESEAYGIGGGTNGYGGEHLADLVIDSAASVKGTTEIDAVNSAGDNVYLNIFDTTGGKAPVINGSLFPIKDHNGENKLYLYYAKRTKVRTLYRPEIVVEGCGTAEADVDVCFDGETVNLTAEADEGYAFCKWVTTPEVEISMNSFVMPEGGVTVKAVFGKLRKITAEASDYCELMPSRTMAVSGEKITLRTVPEKGAQLVGWETTPADLTITGNSFIMPECDVTVKAIYTPCQHTETYFDGAADATCTEAGSTGTEICSACGEVLNEAVTIPAAGHTFGAEEVLAPTCTERGYGAGIVCEVCGATIKTQSYTEALGHSFTTTPEIPATCTANGMTQGAVCVRCGYALIESKVIPAAGHIYDDGVIVKVPTETEDGVKLYTCTVCGMSKAETITVSDHVYVIEDAKAPTCTEAGATVRVYCKDCGLILLDSTVIPAAGHEYIYEPAVAPTCVLAGHTASVICGKCGYVHTEMTTVPPTGEHLWNSGTVTLLPTASANGEITYTCTVCGAARKDLIPVDPNAGTGTGTGTGGQSSAGEEYICAKCGRVHATNLLGKFNCFFFRVGDFFRNLFK